MINLKNLQKSCGAIRKSLKDFYEEYFVEGFVDLSELIREAKMVRKIQENKLLETDDKTRPIYPADIED